MNNRPSDALIASLEAIVGARWVRKRAAELQVFDADGLPGYRMLPSLAVLPGTRDELIAVVRALAQAKVAFVPRGAGTGLSGGALGQDIVVLGLNRLTRILSIDAENGLAHVEPGVVNVNLGRAVAPLSIRPGCVDSRPGPAMPRPPISQISTNSPPTAASAIASTAPNPNAPSSPPLLVAN